MKLISIRDNDIADCPISEWAEENIEPGDWLYIASDHIAMWEQDIPKYHLNQLVDLDYEVFKNDGELTEFSEELR